MPIRSLAQNPPRLLPERHPLDLLGRLKDLPLGRLDVLNLGAGICGSPISEQVQFLPCRRLINVEKFAPYMRQLEGMPFAAGRTEFFEIDIMEYLRGGGGNAKPGRVDVTLLIDVLEHLPEADAREMLDRLAKITRRRILVWLPLGHCPIEPIHDNPFQVHLSEWSGDDRAFRGHQVEEFPRFHGHLDPPADAGWVTMEIGKGNLSKKIFSPLKNRKSGGDQ